MSSKRQNVIVTGIPRSGTTLVTAMIDGLPSSVAFNEPYRQFEWVLKNAHRATSEEFVSWIVKDFGELREKLARCIPIPDRRAPDGSPVTDYHRRRPTDQRNSSIFEMKSVIRPGFDPDSIVCVKHNGLYLSILKELVKSQKFVIIAMIRHPVGVISSWNEVAVPPGRGKMPGAMAYWDEMRRLTESNDGHLRKQVAMYDLICQRLFELRHAIHVMKYEDIIEDPNRVGTLLGRDIGSFRERIEKRNVIHYSATEEVSEAISQYGDSYRLFYPD